MSKRRAIMLVVGLIAILLLVNALLASALIPAPWCYAESFAFGAFLGIFGVRVYEKLLEV